MRSWLVISALAVCGCEEEQQPNPWPSQSQGNAGSTQTPPVDLTSADWTWTECGALPALALGAKHAQFALDGEALLVTYSDGSLLLHRVGQVAAALLRRAGETVQPHVSPDGRQLVDWSGDKLVFQDLNDFREQRELSIDTTGCGAAFSLNDDGSRLLFVGSPASCVFDAQTGARLAQLATTSSRVAYLGDRFVLNEEGVSFTSHENEGTFIARALLDVPAGSLVVELTQAGLAVVERPDHSYAIFEAETGTLLGEGEASEFPDRPILSPDGKLMLIRDQVVRLSDGEVERGSHPSLRRDGLLSLSLDGTRVALIDGFERENRAALVEVESGAGVQVFGGHGRPVLSVAVSPDGTSMVSTSGEQTIGYTLADEFAETRGVWLGDADIWISASYSPDGSLIAISGDGRALLDAKTGRRVLSPPPPPGVIQGCPNAYFTFSGDQRWVAGGGYQFAIDVFDVGDLLLRTTLPSSSCNAAAAFSPDNALLATSVPELYRTSDWTRVWPETVTDSPNQSTFWTNVSFRPDGSSIAVSRCTISENGLACQNDLYDTMRGMKSLAGGSSGALSFSPDGAWQLTGAALVHRLGKEAVRLGRALTASTFAPNGDVIGGDEDGKLYRFCKSEGK